MWFVRGVVYISIRQYVGHSLILSPLSFPLTPSASLQLCPNAAHVVLKVLYPHPSHTSLHLQLCPNALDMMLEVLYFCTAVLLYYCTTTVPLYYCTVLYCTTVLLLVLYYCTVSSSFYFFSYPPSLQLYPNAVDVETRFWTGSS